MNEENLSVVELNHPWLLTYKFLGPPCTKLFRDKTCTELFAQANLQSTRDTGSRKRKNDKLSRKDEREDYIRRTQPALKRAVAGKDAGQDNVLHMNTVMRGVEMLASTRKNEFDMLARALDIYGAGDPRANTLKDTMFELLTNRRSMRQQISEVKQNLQVSAIDLTGASPSVPTEDIDPLHATSYVTPILTPSNVTPNPVSPPSRDKVVVQMPTTIPDPITQVNHLTVCTLILLIHMCLCSQLAIIPRFSDRQPCVDYECEKKVYVARSRISGYGLCVKNRIPKHSVTCFYSGDLVNLATMSDSNNWISHLDKTWGIDSQHKLNFSDRWVNHSLSNNAKISLPDAGLHYDGRIKRFCLYIYTLRDIDRNEEITVSYGEGYWTIDGVLSPCYYTL